LVRLDAPQERHKNRVLPERPFSENGSKVFCFGSVGRIWRSFLVSGLDFRWTGFWSRLRSHFGVNWIMFVMVASLGFLK
jgi:hypothetical protein